MPVGHLADLIWRYKSALGCLGAALIAAGLPIRFTDRAAGVVTVAVDCSKLGWLMLTATGLAPTLPRMAGRLGRLTGLHSL
jgi:hypothetical protein